MSGYVVTWLREEESEFFYSLEEARDIVRTWFPEVSGLPGGDFLNAGEYAVCVTGADAVPVAEIRRAGKPTKIVITLEIAGDAADAMTVVDAILENGLLQDRVNDHEHSDAGPLRVWSATAEFGDEPASSASPRS